MTWSRFQSKDQPENAISKITKNKNGLKKQNVYQNELGHVFHYATRLVIVETI